MSDVFNIFNINRCNSLLFYGNIYVGIVSSQMKSQVTIILFIQYKYNTYYVLTLCPLKCCIEQLIERFTRIFQVNLPVEGL